MRWRDRFRTLLAQSALFIVLPLFVLFAAAAAAGLLAYQRSVASLVIDRDRQLAMLSASRISEAVLGYAAILETLASNPQVAAGPASQRREALTQAAEALEVFSAGVVVVDAAGEVVASVPAEAQPVPSSVAQAAYFQSVRDRLVPEFSNVLADARLGEDMVLIAVPILDDRHQFKGALLGAVYLSNAPLGDPIRRLILGDEGFGYLVDGQGRVIFHPDAESIGADFSDRPFVQRVIAGESGGIVWQNSTGERLVYGYAPVETSGWGLVVREPWDAVIEPVRAYTAAVIAAALLAGPAAALLLWWGVRRITLPVQLLAAQIQQVAAGEPVQPLGASPIIEMEALEQAFGRMAAQIAAYRAGLHRYVGAITTSQEDERRRIARELHDETAQSLLAISRRLELDQTFETDPQRLDRLREVQSMVSATLGGVRAISRDLRPLVLEDLGLVAALRALIGSARKSAGAPGIAFEFVGPEAGLSPDQELALYRITQEALTNIQRHSRADKAQVRLKMEPTLASLEISDDGQGFDTPATLTELAQRGHFGLLGIQERVWAVGGQLTIHSAPGAGTRLAVTIPRDGQVASNGAMAAPAL
jgi:signal transduction histidine kinase